MARYLSVGSEDYPFHPHGNNGLVVGRDGHELKNGDGKDLSMEKFAINIGPGRRGTCSSSGSTRRATARATR